MRKLLTAAYGGWRISARMGAVALLGGTMLCSGSLSAADTTYTRTSRGWDITAHETGNCSAFRRYEGDITFWMGWSVKHNAFHIGFSKGSWTTIKEDGEYTIRVATDGNPNWGAGTYIGMAPNGMVSKLGIDLDFVKALALANAVRFYQTDKHLFTLQLDGSYEAILQTLECQKDLNARVTQPGNVSNTRAANSGEVTTETNKTWNVPIVRHSTNIELQGKVNDAETLTFMLDTGATAVSIPRAVANRLGLKTVKQVEVEYADGRKGKEDVVRIDKLSIGGVVFLRDVYATVTSAGQPLLGKNYLDRFSSYAIDNKNSVLVLRK